MSTKHMRDHAPTHGPGQQDALPLDDLAEPSDSTKLDASTERHGLLPKLSGVSEEVLRGDGTWSPVAGEGLGELINNPDPTLITVGGIQQGTTFDDVTLNQFVDHLLYPESNPTLTAPSTVLSLPQGGYRELGESVDLDFTATFNRGSINPQNTSESPFRSGPAISYEYQATVSDKPENVESSSGSNSQTVSSYVVVAGAQSWQARVYHEAGVQPKTNKGNDYDAPLAEGYTPWSDPAEITGVLPVFATTASIGTLTKQPLGANSRTIEVAMMAEAGASKQTIDFPNDEIEWGAITGIQQYDTISGTWVWLLGSKPLSLGMFTVTTTTHEIQGITRNYQRYTHNGSTIGARLLRFHTT